MLGVLLIDNFDSFTFNLVDELAKRGAVTQVWRNDVGAERALAIAAAMPAPRLVVLSPGPGAPSEAGCCVELVRAALREADAGRRFPLFGVCLGHQAIVEALGGEVGFAGEVVHGKAGRVVHDGTGLFAGLPSPMFAGRYHSLAARRLPPSLRVTARIDAPEGLVMAVEHERAPIAGVQFHPESILTPRGGQLFDRLVAWAEAA